MKAALFCAGLGDVIRVIYESVSYKFISEATSPVPVIVASHNPFAMEIFRFHRNARNFILFELAHKYEEYLGAGLRGADINRALCEFAGVDYAQLARGNANGYVPEFHAMDNIASTGHIVFQPFAGNASYRSLPEPLIEKIVAVLRNQSRPVFLVTRTYLRPGGGGKVIHAEEDARRHAGGNITLLEHTSVPATLNLMKTASAYIGSWSSLQQAAWFENKPVAVFYPENYGDVVNRTGYAFGIDRSDCFHAEYPKADMAGLAEWVNKW